MVIKNRIIIVDCSGSNYLCVIFWKSIHLMINNYDSIQESIFYLGLKLFKYLIVVVFISIKHVIFIDFNNIYWSLIYNSNFITIFWEYEFWFKICLIIILNNFIILKESKASDLFWIRLSLKYSQNFFTINF
jgi:hypothetical protein